MIRRFLSTASRCSVAYRCLIDNGTAYWPFLPLRSLEEELLLLDWPAIEKDLKDLDTSAPASGEEYFRGLQIRGGKSRISALFFVTIGEQSMWVPAIVDTGAHAPLSLSKRALEEFGWRVNDDIVEAKCDIVDAKGQHLGSDFSASIGHWRGRATVIPNFEVPNGEINDSLIANIVGMGILAPEIAEAVAKILSQRFRQVGPPHVLWVMQCDSHCKSTGTAFKVTPATADIDALKKAIKAELGTDYTRSPALLTILEPGDPAKKVVEPDQSLKGNTAKTPYLFQLPGDSTVKKNKKK